MHHVRTHETGITVLLYYFGLDGLHSTLIYQRQHYRLWAGTLLSERSISEV